jgi:hypothetical protein
MIVPLYSPGKNCLKLVMTRSVGGGSEGFGGKKYIRLQGTSMWLISAKPNV